MKKFLLSCAVAALALPAFSQDALTLSFDVTSTDAEDTEVIVDGIEGVTASIKSMDVDLKELDDPKILCPNVNGNNGMDVLLQIELKGLPAGTSFNGVGLYVWAYNGQGGLQNFPWDEKNRFFNVEVYVDDKDLANFEDIDVAASVEEANSGAEFEAEQGVVQNVGDPAILELHITSGSENVGCFFGLESITLYTVAGSGEGEGGEEPGEEPGETPSAGTAIEVAIDNTLVARFDTGSLVWGDYEEFPGTGFYASILTDSTPEVTITCVNGNREDEPGINNIGTSTGSWYDLYSANEGNGQLALYRFEVADGYIITSISAYLNGEANVTWTYNDDEYVNDGSELAIAPNSQFVELTAVAVDGSVKATTWEDFVITVAEEGSTAVKGLESVDANAPVEFFDLQGRKVSNPSNGIFIRRQGNQTTKVVVK